MDTLPEDFKVTITTKRLTLVTDVGLEHVAALGELAAQGIHDRARQPFGNAWTDAAPQEIRDGLYFHLSTGWDYWDPEDWECAFTVLLDGKPIGVQTLSSVHFQPLQEVRTGSWLGRRFQRQGYGTEMRAAVLKLAFAGLGASFAMTGAHSDNRAAVRVNQKLGYQYNGTDRKIVRGKVVKELRYRLGLTGYLRHVAPRYWAEIEGAYDHRRWFGVDN